MKERRHPKTLAKLSKANFLFSLNQYNLRKVQWRSDVPKKKRPSPETPLPETQLAPPAGSGKQSISLSPWTILQKAIKAVPSLKYALGVLGIVSAIAIIRSFGIDFRIAVFGTITMVVLMTALVVFAALTKVTSPQVSLAALVLMWSFLALTILSAALLFTSVFFSYPKPLSELFGLTPAHEEPKPTTLLLRMDNPGQLVVDDEKPEKGAGFVFEFTLSNATGRLALVDEIAVDVLDVIEDTAVVYGAAMIPYKYEVPLYLISASTRTAFDRVGLAMSLT